MGTGTSTSISSYVRSAVNRWHLIVMVFSTILPPLAEEFLRRLLGVLQPKLLMEGIDLELKLAERELLDKLAVLLDSLTLLGLPKRS